MLKRARIAAGDRALVLLAVGDIDERVVPAHAAAAAVDIFLYAGADDAADILLAAERALGKAAVHRCAGETGDAAGIAAVFVRDGAGRRLTRSQIAEVHAADNAADIAALAGHIAGVDALLDDGAVLILLAVDVRKMARDIVLGVERVFNGHGACDAAGIHIAVHRAAVAAGRDFTKRDGIDVDIGGVDNDVARAADCLQKAGFSDRLARMPKGLDTCLYKDLDEDGVTISGGEAQKIAIARALYKDAPFIVLDEPTAALDPVAEAEIYAKFNEIAGDKTAIYISHRLSSCKFCDEIAVFDQGEVVQQGTHEELLGEPDGKYYELWNAQAQYYTEESA